MTWVVVKPVVLLCKKSLDWHIRREYQKKNWRLFAIKPSNAAHSSNHNLYTFLDLVERNLLCGCKPKKTYGHCSALKQLRRFLWNISECLSSCCEISTQAWSRKRATFALSSTSTTVQVQVQQSVHNTIPVSSPPISWKFRNLSFMWLWFHVNISIAFKRHRFEKKCMKDRN